MIAYRLLNAQTQPEFQEVPEPHAGPGQVVVKVGGSGLCHTGSGRRSLWMVWERTRPSPHLVGRAVVIPEGSEERAV